MAGVVASDVFRSNSRCFLAYKGMQPAKNDVIWCKKYFPGTSGLCVMEVKEEEYHAVYVGKAVVVCMLHR